MMLLTFSPPELEEAIRSQCPHAYRKRLKVVKNESRKLKNVRLPRSDPKPLRAIKRLPRPLEHPWNQLMNIFKCFGGVLAVCIGGSILYTGVTFLLLTVGLLKFGFHCVGQGGLVFDAEREDARSPIKFKWVKLLSFGLFLVAVKLFLMANWSQWIFLNLLALFLAVTGYCLDGSVGNTVWTVLKASFLFLRRL